MAIKVFNKNKENINVNNKSKKKKQPNWIIRITLLVIIVPTIFVAFILLTSIEKSGTPVKGKRFDTHLDPKIEEKSVNDIKTALTYDNVDKVEVNLKSATLRVSIDTADVLGAEDIEAIAHDAYARVLQILPVDPYFQNRDKIKMYDLEIHVFNLIPNQDLPTASIYCLKYKNAAAEAEGFDWLSTPKNEDVSNSLLHPNGQ